MKSLLIIACSRSKNPQPELLPALERYNGPTFRLLRRFLRQNSSFPLDIYIVSAKFGLIPSDQLIPVYDEKMTKTRSQVLQPGVISKLEAIIKTSSYKNLYFCVGKAYFAGLDGYSNVIGDSIEVHIATGSIGNKLVKLHTWLYGKPPELPQYHSAETVSNKIIFKGVEVELTKEDIIKKASQWLVEKKRNPFALMRIKILPKKSESGLKYRELKD